MNEYECVRRQAERYRDFCLIWKTHMLRSQPVREVM